MAKTVRSGANSAYGTSLVDTDIGASLLVTIDGFYWGADRAITLSGEGASATIAGLVAGSSKTATGIGIVSTIPSPVTNQPVTIEDTTLTVLATGVVTGTTAIQLSGAGVQILSNRGIIEGVKTGIAFGGLPGFVLTNAGEITATSGGTAIQSSATHHTYYCSIGNSKNGEINGNIKLVNIMDTWLSNLGTINGSYSSAAEYSFVSNSGTINGGVTLKGNNNTVSNAGVMGGYRGGAGADTVFNSGKMGTVHLGAGENRMTNSGEAGDIFAESYLELENSGVVTGSVLASGVNSYINNSGTIKRVIKAGEGDDRVSNTSSGTVVNGVILGSGNDELYNSGKIGSVDGGAGDDRVYNVGTLRGLIQMGDGTDTVFHSGTCEGRISMGSGNDIVVTGGTYKNQAYDSGSVVGEIWLGAGDDTFQGGTFRDVVNGGAGADKVDLGAGDDKFLASAEYELKAAGGVDGGDAVDGGSGSDTYSAAAATGGVTIDLAAGSASGASIGTDQISNFENATGSNFNDTLTGNEAANLFGGADGNDTISGFDGDDALFGGKGSDSIAGGAGRDTLSGGDDADVFVFASRDDSLVAREGRDTILDFKPGSDKIDLSLIDAVTTDTGETAFTFIGTAAFGGTAGELRASAANGVTVVSADVDGDKVADFAISLKGAMTLAATDFVL